MMLRIPFAYARENQSLLRKSVTEEDFGVNLVDGFGLLALIHSPLTALGVLQEVFRLVGPIVRIEQSSESVLEALNTVYSQGDLNAAQVVDEAEEMVDLSRLLQ